MAKLTLSRIGIFLLLLTFLKFSLGKVDLPENSICEKALQKYYKFIFNNTIDDNSTEILYDFLHNGKHLNDLGDYYACSETFNYTYFYLTPLTGGEISLGSVGICLPSDCTKEYLKSASEHLAKSLIKQMKNKKMMEEDNKVSNISLLFVNPDENMNNIRNSKFAGFIILTVLLSLLLIFSIFAFFYTFCKKEQKQRQASNTVMKFNKLIRNSDLNNTENNINLNESSNQPSDDHMRKSLMFKATRQTDSNIDISKSIEDTKKRKQLDSKVSPFQIVISSFDIINNFIKIFNVERNSQMAEDLSVFDGIKAYMMCWVILSHMMTFVVMFPIKNIIDLVNYNNFVTSIIIDGGFSVDIFFFLSAFLMIVSLVKDKKANPIVLFIYRFFRLFPLYAFVLLAGTYMMPFLLDGPNAETGSSYNKDCPQIIWKNLLFINNFGRDSRMCGGHTWYLANDMQFFVFTLIVWFGIMSKKRWIGNLIFSFAIVANIIVNYCILYFDEISIINLKQYATGQTVEHDFYTSYYYLPYHRIAPYAMGILFGQYYIWEHPFKDNITRTMKNNGFAKWGVFTFALFLLAFPCYLNYEYIQNVVKFENWLSTFSITFGKMFFTLGTAIIIQMTINGHLSAIKSFFSVKLYTPIARISYGVYLVHIYICFYIYGSYPSSIFYDQLDLFIICLGCLMISIITSLFLCLIFDSPIVGLLKLIVRPNNKSNKA
jgi:peptidoglycan/LPS O-acetylase OafA/YrhL